MEKSFIKSVEDTMPSIEIIEVSKHSKANRFIVTCRVTKGFVEVGDTISLKTDGKMTLYYVDNIYLFAQQTSIVFAGEKCSLVVIPMEKSKANNVLVANQEHADVISESIMSMGILPKLNDDMKKIFQHSPSSFIENTDLSLLLEDATSDAGDKGLKAIISGGTLAKGLGIAAVLSIFVYKLYGKLEKSCIGKVGSAATECKKANVNKVISALSQQQSHCNTLSDPIQRKSCLKNVESKKKKWINKLTELSVK